jgi:DNA repair photolyase
MAPFLPDPDASPRLFRDLLVEPEEARSILRHQKDDRYGWGFSVNPYRGCTHGCRYCYVRDYPAPAPGHDPQAGAPKLHDPKAWGAWVTPKLNAPALLWAQRHRLHGQKVFMASATDPYQPVEREFRLTRKCLQVLLACPTTQVILHTRSPMILQDLALLKAFGDRLSIGFSIPTDDEAVRQVVEPDAPPLPARWSAVEKLAKAGLRVGIAAAPLLPVHDAAAFARRARSSGANSAWVGGLRLLKQDPFHDVLAERGWLHILDPLYVEEVRAALRQALPPKPRPVTRLRPEPVWVPQPAAVPGRMQAAIQPGLFEHAS